MPNWYQNKDRRIKTSSKMTKQSAFIRKGDPYHPSKGRQEIPLDKSGDVLTKNSSVLHIRNITSMGDIFYAYVEQLSEQLQNEVPSLETMNLELREAPDLGFRFTEFTEDESIRFFFDVSLRLAPDYINLDIKGASSSSSFSDTLRLFMTDTALQTVRRLASIIRLQK